MRGNYKTRTYSVPVPNRTRTDRQARDHGTGSGHPELRIIPRGEINKPNVVSVVYLVDEMKQVIRAPKNEK